jgi:hypothetical protein
MPEDQQVFGDTVAATDIVGHHVVGIQVGEIAIDQHKRYFVGRKPPDRLVVRRVADGEDDHTRDRVGAQACDVAVQLLEVLFGVGKAYLVATRLGGVLDPDQNVQIKLAAGGVRQHQADSPLGHARGRGDHRRKRAHECAAPTHTFEQAFMHQRAHGLPDSAAADLVLLGQLQLGRQARARPQATVEDLLAKQADELSISGHYLRRSRPYDL